MLDLDCQTLRAEAQSVRPDTVGSEPGAAPIRSVEVCSQSPTQRIAVGKQCAAECSGPTTQRCPNAFLCFSSVRDL